MGDVKEGVYREAPLSKFRASHHCLPSSLPAAVMTFASQGKESQGLWVGLLGQPLGKSQPHQTLILLREVIMLVPPTLPQGVSPGLDNEWAEKKN